MLRADATSAPHAPAVPGPRRESRPSAGAATRPAARRDPFLDNAKYLAIVLVAVGHAWEPLRAGSRTVTALYMLVYAFHMPVFAVISGYLSRGFEATPRNLGRLLTRLALPYVVFEVAYTLFTRWTSEDPDRPISLLDPLYLTWFLMALFIWRLTTPVWKALRWPLPVALALAAAATLSPSIGDDLNLQRVLQFLPYFVLGLCLKPGQVGLVHRREARLLAVPVFVCALLLAYWAVPRMNYAWFFHNDSAASLAAPAWYGPVMTLATFGCSITLTACFLAWVPRRRTPFTILGAGTLYGYLLHGFIAQGAEYADWYDAAWLHRPTGALVVTLTAAAIMTALCTPPVQRTFRCVLEPRMRWAFRPRSGP
ncbi:acyltransferase family protein [Streptomyces ferrugineus]|uniref:Acyltransferase family protein n=1 Tax=Streptomyces ferrugineus TaxID=1413221 RepID=A0A7M2SN88_9ACTN|nr:acyltransferase family protein [Streptomyces ferrugineus]QOV36701.1 acyltransferase family protein [Streptomyces ferrugineus]